MAGRIAIGREHFWMDAVRVELEAMVWRDGLESHQEFFLTNCDGKRLLGQFFS